MVETMLREGNNAALLGRFPTLTEVADAAAFMASNRAGAMTATVANLTCGSCSTELALSSPRPL